MIEIELHCELYNGEWCGWTDYKGVISLEGYKELRHLRDAMLEYLWFKFILDKKKIVFNYKFDE